MADDLLQDFEKRVDVNEYDAALIPVQLASLDAIKHARDYGTEEEILHAVVVAKEVGAL